MDENERGTSKRANTVGTIIYVGRIGRYLERKHARGLGGRITRI